MRFGLAGVLAAAPDVAAGSPARDAASATLAIAGMVVGVGSLVVLFRPDTQDPLGAPGAVRRRVAVALFVLAGAALAAGIFLASL